MEQFFFFWGGNASQWAASRFVIDGVEFNCCEQYMMYRKALLFGDADTAEKVMATSNPKEQKALGRQVKGFDDARWKQEARLIVYRGNRAKFMQNPLMLQWLLEVTEGKTLVEASPMDKLWGIGLDESDPLALSRDTWQGLNWLGEIITNVRDDIMADFVANLDAA